MIITTAPPKDPPPNVDPAVWAALWSTVATELDKGHADGIRAASAVKRQRDHTDAAKAAVAEMYALTLAAGT